MPLARAQARPAGPVLVTFALPQSGVFSPLSAAFLPAVPAEREALAPLLALGEAALWALATPATRSPHKNP